MIKLLLHNALTYIPLHFAVCLIIKCILVIKTRDQDRWKDYVTFKL